MVTADDVRKLASLARLSLDEATLEAFTKEFDAILGYVSQLETLKLSGKRTKPALCNVMREDGVPHESGAYTKKLAEQFPEREGDYLVVKQIISHE